MQTRHRCNPGRPCIVAVSLGSGRGDRCRDASQSSGDHIGARLPWKMFTSAPGLLNPNATSLQHQHHVHPWMYCASMHVYAIQRHHSDTCRWDGHWFVAPLRRLTRLSPTMPPTVPRPRAGNLARTYLLTTCDLGGRM